MHLRVSFLLNRIREHLWIRPFLMCLLSALVIFVAKIADGISWAPNLADVNQVALESLLTIIATSMLVIATFAVGSMISAFAAAGSRATPRSFSLIIADDPSQKALSTFLGAFIFSLFALIAVQSNFYEAKGLLTVFVITVLVISRVVFIFVRWTDKIVRLGRVGTTIDQVEDAAKKALSRRKQSRRMGGTAVPDELEEGISIFSDSIGHLQMINLPTLQAFATAQNARITVLVLPGTFIFPNMPIACVHFDEAVEPDFEKKEIQGAFVIGTERTYDEDPCFGLIVLSEIASRALSPAVNDPGTGIKVIGSMVRLFSIWLQPNESDERIDPLYDRVAVPELKLEDMLNDAFSAIARDGAKNIEVGIWLQKGFASLASLGNSAECTVIKAAAQAAFKRAEKSLEFSEDLELLKGGGSSRSGSLDP